MTAPEWLHQRSPDPAHDALRAAVVAALEQMQQQINELSRAWDAINLNRLQGAGVQSGAAWQQPAGAHDAYPSGFEVTHNGKRWASLVSANVWEPGVANWREVVAAPSGPPAWVQPSGGTDAYAAEALVTHAGRVWRSDVPANVWEPGVFGWTVQP